jgi:hypothetical protein
MTSTSRSLLALLHELSDCLATALSEDAITQQSAEVESVALRMRKVLLSLLGDCIQVQTGGVFSKTGKFRMSDTMGRMLIWEVYGQ